ncbi:hypothetical protein E2C01_015127 [Portunus trituberculatus]|uniref:Uncharacterized protein n=1 Tax=Portunus trituberculatus TaxID=210409 RepID=A0A5B7DKV1_PORTR|nr:hypothetical protein [Portunus trituberculatus]
MTCGSQVVRGRGKGASISGEGRALLQDSNSHSVTGRNASHSNHRPPPPGPHHTQCSIAPPTSVLIPSAFGVGRPLRPIKHFLLQCPHFHSHHTALCSRLSILAITTLELPTLLAASGVHSSWQPAVLHLICAFLRKTGQLPCL